VRLRSGNGAPKAAIEALVRGIAREEGRFGVRANSVALGVIETGIFLRLAGKDFDQEWVEAARGNTALKRFGTAEEVADAVVFLASARASYVTGQTLVLDGATASEGRGRARLRAGAPSARR
jgi:NAD(P)-dependent dehydrogenase (short-subunit alcohol dehydrogenase family)